MKVKFKHTLNNSQNYKKCKLCKIKTGREARFSEIYGKIPAIAVLTLDSGLNSTSGNVAAHRSVPGISSGARPALSRTHTRLSS